MRYVAVLVVGMVLLALGGQGGIRLLLDDDPGLLSALPGGNGIQLIVYVVVTVVGIGLAAWGAARARATGHLS
jgi:hypothetical protein